MTNADKVLRFLESISPQGASNSEIGARTGVRPHQQVFQITQRLSQSGKVNSRLFGNEWQFWMDTAKPDGPTEDASAAADQRGRLSSLLERNHRRGATDDLSEDDVKRILVDWLEQHGWSVKVAWGRERGADCIAVKGIERWIIEVKGCGSRQPMRVNYFLAALGEALQRMDDAGGRYSVAFPDMAQFRGLWERLPKLAKQRTQLTALFARADGTVDVAE